MRRVQIKVESIHLGPAPGDWVVAEGETTQMFTRHKLVRAMVPVREARKAAMQLARGARTVTITVAEDRILSVQPLDTDDVYVPPDQEPFPDLSVGGGAGPVWKTGDRPWEVTPAFDDDLQEW